MFRYFANIIFSPMHWIWDNIINRPIYGVRIWQIAFVMICISLFYRIFIIPTIGGQNFSIHTPGGTSTSGAAYKVGRSYRMYKSEQKSKIKMEKDKL